MSNPTVTIHALADIIEGNLLGIEGVPTVEQCRMKRRCAKEIFEWHEEEVAALREALEELVDDITHEDHSSGDWSEQVVVRNARILLAKEVVSE